MDGQILMGKRKKLSEKKMKPIKQKLIDIELMLQQSKKCERDKAEQKTHVITNT